MTVGALSPRWITPFQHMADVFPCWGAAACNIARKNFCGSRYKTKKLFQYDIRYFAAAEGSSSPIHNNLLQLNNSWDELEFVWGTLLSSALTIDKLDWDKHALTWKWVQHSINTIINCFKVSRQENLTKSPQWEQAVTKSTSNPKPQEPSHTTLCTLLHRRWIVAESGLFFLSPWWQS